MIALAIIFLLLAAALVVGIAVTGTSQQVVLDSTVGTFTTQPVWIFVAGVVATLLALLGLSFLGRGTRRRVERRREMRRLRRVEEQQSARHDVERARADESPLEPRDGYDEPDRHLVRDSRATTVTPESPAPAAYDPDAGDHLRHRPARPADQPVVVDEPAHHRQP
jgi:uncharacterized membrane protein YcjF (UPF0283 family)